MSVLRNFIFRTINEAAKVEVKAKSASLTGLQSDLEVALPNLKARGYIQSHGKIKNVSPGKSRVSVKYTGSKGTLVDNIINFYGQFIKVT